MNFTKQNISFPFYPKMKILSYTHPHVKDPLFLMLITFISCVFIYLLQTMCKNHQSSPLLSIFSLKLQCTKDSFKNIPPNMEPIPSSCGV